MTFPADPAPADPAGQSPTADDLPPAAPGRDFMAEHGAKLVACGYPILPIRPGAKCPGRYRASAGWQGYPDWTRHADRPTKPFELAVWSTWPGCGVGVACGTVGGLDLDILEPELAAELEALARAELGDTPAVRIGKAPKRLLLYRQAAPFAKVPRGPIEWLGRGAQLVAYGVHPGTREPYRWPFEELHAIRAERLPLVSEEQARAFLDQAVQLVPAELKVSRLAPDRPAGFSFARGGELAGTLEATRAACDHIPNDDLPYDDWVRIGLAIKGSVGEAGWPIVDAWSRRSAKHEAQTTREAWRGFQPERIGFGSLQHHAARHGWSPDLALAFNARKAAAEAKAAAEPVVDLSVLTAKARARPPRRPAASAVAADPEALVPIVATPTFTAAATPPAPPGILAEVAGWIVATSSQPHPNLALQAATALVGLLAAHQYRLVHGGHDTRSNVMLIGIAESSAGKDHARRCVKAVLDRIGMAGFYGEGFASGQAIEAAFVKRAARLYLVDEFGLLLEAALSRNGNPNPRKIVETITRLSTSAAGMFKPADRAEARELDREVPLTWDPCLTLIATTVEEPLWRALSSGNVSDGSLARYLIARTEPFPDVRLDAPHFEDRLGDIVQLVSRVLAGPGSEPTPFTVGRALGALQASLSDDGQSRVRVTPPRPSPLAVPLEPAAKASLDRLVAETLALQRAHHRHRTHGIVGRLKEHTARLALIAAVAADPKHPRVTAAHVAWGEQMARSSIAVLLEAAEKHIADSDHQRDRNGVLADIARLSGPANAWVRARDLTRNGATARKLDREARGKALADLVEMELIESGTDKSGSQPVLLYRMRT